MNWKSWGVKNGIQEFFEETNMLEKILQRYERLYEKKEKGRRCR